MKKITMLVTLGCFSALSANPYYQSSCPSCNQGQAIGYYQGQGQDYYRQDSYQYPQRGYTNNQGYSGSYQYEGQSGGMQNSYNQNPSYNQGQQRYYDQQRNYDNNSGYSQGNNPNQQRNWDNDSNYSSNYSQGNNPNQQRSWDNDSNYSSNYSQGNNPNQQGYNNYNSSNGQGGSDQEVNKELHNTLGSGWFSRGYQNVSFDVNNGYVTLRGTVDTLEDKNKVEEKVRQIKGVKQVNNQITVSQNKNQQGNYSESDLQNTEAKYPNDSASSQQDRIINSKIRQKLSDNWFSKSYDALVIRTTNGVVVIAGTVDKDDDIQKINDQVKGIEGVKSVNNQVTVKNK